jgi:glycosyltransferase involved in cell wall biosynthesis
MNVTLFLGSGSDFDVIKDGLEILKEFDVPIIKTMHNFWDFCPKEDLLYRDVVPCSDFGNGEKCLECLSSYCEEHVPINVRIKGTINSPVMISTLNYLGRVRNTLFASRSKKGCMPITYTPQAYRKRREYFVNMLKLCNMIHTTSQYCSEKLIGLGIESSRIRVVPLSVRILSRIKPKPLFVIRYPIVFGYRGAIDKKKGLYILLRAFAQVDQNKSKLIIYGDGDKNIVNDYRGDTLNMEYKGYYAMNQIQESLKSIDVGIMPSIWEEPFGIVGLEYLTARIPVIGSNIGGITEWLRDGENGFLFTPGNVDELSRVMRKFVDSPELVGVLQSRIKPWKTMRVHALEMSDLYNNLLEKKTTI